MALDVRRTGSADYGRYMKLLICGDPGAGKGLVLDTPVLTPSGWREIGSLVVGDEVVGSNGRPVAVTHVFDRGELPTYRVSFSDGASVVCDGDHLWSLMTRKTRYTSQKRKVVSVLSLLDSRITVPREGRKDRHEWYVPLVQAVEHPKVDLPVEPYLLGVLLANGALGDSSVTFTTNDSGVINEVLSRCVDLDIAEHQRAVDVVRRWAIRGFHPVLRQLGVDRLKSRDKFVPNMYLTAHEEARRGLLAGLMDCDGSACGTKCPRYFTTSPLLRDDVVALVRSLGGIATWTVDARDEASPCYVIRVQVPFNPFITAKKADANHYRRTPYRALVGVEPCGVAETRCIKVDAEDELFVTDHYLVTHNTLISSTFPNVLYASAEGGMMSVFDRDVSVVDITESGQLLELKNALDQNPEVRAKRFKTPVDTVVIDTIDEVARILQKERMSETNKDTMAMQDWGWYGDQLRAIIRSYRNLPLNVIFTCHLKMHEDAETGATFVKPAIQGQVGDEIAGYVDIAVLLQARPKTEVVNGETQRRVVRYLQTYQDTRHPWIKDRSGKLPMEFPVDFETDWRRLNGLIYGVKSPKDAPTPKTPVERAAPASLKKTDTASEPQTPVENQAEPAHEQDLEAASVAVSEPETVPESAPVEDDSMICESCKGAIETEDQRDFSLIRFRERLCRKCVAAKKKK